MATTPGITPGDWTYEPLDPGHSGSREEPPEPGGPAYVYAVVRDVDEKLGEPVEYEVPICKMESPIYQRLVRMDIDYDRFGPPPIEAKDRGFAWEPVPAGDESANARFMAGSPSMWRALKAARSAMQDTDGALDWGGPWAGVFDAIDGAIKRVAGVEGYEDHDGRTRRGS